MQTTTDTITSRTAISKRIIDFAGCDGSSSSAYYNPNYSSKSELYTDQRTRVKGIGWRLKVKTGGEATNYYQRVGYRIETKKEFYASVTGTSTHCVAGFPNCSVKCNNTRNTEVRGVPSQFNWPVSSFAFLGASPTTARNKALSKAHERVRAVRSQMNGLQFVGELRESLRMIRNPAGALWKSVDKLNTALHKNKRKISGKRISTAAKLKEMTNVASGLYLETVYGWKPLISDIKSGAETVSRILHEFTPRTRVTGVGESEVVQQIGEGRLDVAGGDSLMVLVYRQARYDRCHSKFVVGLSNRIQGPAQGANRVAELSGFTLENFVPTIWELIPYSFLFDYFLNIGDILNAAFTDQSNVTFVSETTVRTLGLQAWFTPVVQDYQGYVAQMNGCEAGMCENVYRSITRTAPGSLGVPSLELTIPGLSGDQSSRWLNIAALLAARMNGNKSFRF